MSDIILTTQSAWWRGCQEIPSVAFGDSMLPFFKPLSEIRIRPTPMTQVKVGEVVGYRRNGALCAHRVVKAVAYSKGTMLVTKGDNRFQHDPPISESEYVGVVVKSASSDLTKRHWRTIGQVLAFLSYYPSTLSMRLISRLPFGKRLATRLAVFLHPLLLWNRLLNWRMTLRTLRLMGHVSCRRVAIRGYAEGDCEALAKVWNQCFPAEPMDAPTFRGKICQSPWFSPDGCLVATRGSHIVGFILASQRQNGLKPPQSHGRGFIEWIGVDPKSRRQGIGSLLLNSAVRYLRKKGCVRLTTGYFRIPCNEQGFALLGPAPSFFGKFGFEMSALGQEFRVTPEIWDQTIAPRLRDRLEDRGVVLRVARKEDLVPFREAIQQRRYPLDAGLPKGADIAPLSTWIVAFSGGKVRGCCRCLLQDQVYSYDQAGWIWDATVPSGLGYVGWLYVEPEFRSLQMGAALVAYAADTLFERGCRQIRWWAHLPALVSRYRRWNLPLVGAVMQMTQGRNIA